MQDPDLLPPGQSRPPLDELTRRRARGGRPFNTSTPLGKMMERKGLKVGDLAALAGLSERTITDYLNGRRTPSDVNFLYMARALGCRVEAIRG